MSITPLSRSDGTLTNFTPPPIPDHIAGLSEAEFLTFAFEWRKRTQEGKETHNDHQLVSGWLAQCSATGSEETVKSYRRHIDRFRRFIRQWNEQPLQEQTDERLLSPGDSEAIMAFATSLQSEVKEGRMAVSSYNVLIAAISSFYKHWTQPTLRIVSGIPSTPVPSKLQMKKVPRKAKSLSHEQLAAVVYGARQCRNSASARRDALIIRMVYLLGTRATETINLRWSDLVEMESGPAIHIRAEIAKGKKERFVAINSVVLELLDELKASQPESDWMLPSLQQPWKHISRQGLWKLCNRAGKNAGVKCWSHKLRHTHATHAYATTHDPKLIQSTLGHADIGTTMQLYVDETAGDSSTKHLT